MLNIAKRTYPGSGKYKVLPPTPHTMTESIVESILRGVPLNVACASVGIVKETLELWINKSYEDNAEEKYIAFRIAIDEALSKDEARLAKLWEDVVTTGTSKVTTTLVSNSDGTSTSTERTEIVGAGDWRGIAELLRRRYPLNWLPKDKVEITGEGGGPIKVSTGPNLEDLSMETKLLIITELEAIEQAKVKDSDAVIEAECIEIPIEDSTAQSSVSLQPIYSDESELY